MKVQDVMRREARSCGPETDLATVGRLMAEIGGGALPVVEAERVVGMFTDRDLALAVADRDVVPSDLRVRDFLSGEVFVCRADEDVHAVLENLRAWRVRRLPVVDRRGGLEGLLSLDDIAAAAREGSGEGPTWSEIGHTLAEIVRHPLPIHR
ncbi:MAG TPA: CBS domain-containing protein [Thermoanaerobaculia bacterium]|nr:CBS domain-containing protein [Thermoanaerobaculia bacterium]